MTSKERVPLDFRPRLMLGLSRALTKAGLLPTHEKAFRLPLAKRKAVQPARWMTGPMPSGVRTADREITGRGGPLLLRIYEPSAATGPRPLVLYMHGGGWVTGGLESVNHACAHLAAAAGAAVVSVDYRLAPESPYPAALDDSYDALCWVSDHAAEIHADAARIAVMGDSAGGNLAAALCLLARRRGGPSIAHQVLIYPGLDLTLTSQSMSLKGSDVGRETLEAVVRYYLGGADPRDPLVSPLFEPDLAGLPPALIITADFDVVRDDGRRYARRLAEAGVPVRYTNYVRTPHGFFYLPRLCRYAPQALAEIAQELTLAPAGTRDEEMAGS